jgi:hyperosmotically inducible protein
MLPSYVEPGFHHYALRFWRIFMFRPSRNVVPAEGFKIAVSKPSHELLEARQESQILTACALSPYLRAYDFKVTVCRGVATLSGSVADDVSKELATQIVLGVAGIKSMDNQIEVVSNFSEPARSAERSFGEIVDDASITAVVKSKLVWSRHAGALAANVETMHGKVSLSGTASSQEAKDAAGRFAGNTRGVNSVDNQIVVDEAGKPDANEAGTEIADGWITAKVKATFMYSSNVNGSDISVSTNSGVVTLSGKMDSDVERALAIELARNVRGVKSVNSTSLTL